VSDKHIISYLKFSSERAGRLYPVLLDKHGNVIDGIHRLTADKKWPKITIENIETEEQRLIARIISNVCRRHVTAKEKTAMLERLGEIYLNEGVKPGKIAYKIVEETGSYKRR
jgi:ParB-like chromosome segregation protein Spo0J